MSSMAKRSFFAVILFPVNFSICFFMAKTSSPQKSSDCGESFTLGRDILQTGLKSLKISPSFVIPSQVNTLINPSLNSRKGDSPIIFAPIVDLMTGQTSTGTMRAQIFDVSYQPELTRTGIASAAIISSMGANIQKQ